MTSSKSDLELSKKWRHRLIVVLFVIITVIGVVISIVASDWYSWLETSLYILLGIIIWLIINNLIYYEGIVYIISGEHGNSFFRRGKFYYNRITINKRKLILKTIGICIGGILLLKVLILPVASDFLSNMGNDILDVVREKHLDGGDKTPEETQEVKWAQIYCKIGKTLHKSVKNLRCLGRINDNKSQSKYLYLDALGLEPTNEEEIKIRANLAGIYLEENNFDEAEQQINMLFNTSVLKNDLRKNPDILCALAIYLGYITIQKGTLSEALAMIDTAWEYANTDGLKYNVGIARSDMYSIKGEYLTALSIITSMQENDNGYKLTDVKKKQLEEIEAHLRKVGNISNSVSTSTTIETPNLQGNTSYMTSKEPQNDLEYCQQKWGNLFASRGRSPNGTVICGCKEGYSQRVAGPGVVCEPFVQESRTCAMSYGDNSKYDGSKCVCKDGFTMSPDGTYCQGPGGETLLEYCQKTYGPNSAPRENDQRCYQIESP